MPYLSGDDLRRLQVVQQLLLSPPNGDLSVWAEAVCDAARPLFRTDHVYYLEPDTDEGESQGDAAPGDAAPGDVALGDVALGDAEPVLTVHCPSGGSDFEAGIQRHFQGFEDGFSQFLEPYPTLQHRVLRSAGPGAYHDAPIHDTTAREQLRIYQEVFRPVGIDRQMALSAPLPLGEAMLITGHTHQDAPGYDGSRHELMRLLVPAFEAGLRFRHRIQRVHHGLRTAADRLPTPLLIFDADSRERHRNAAFRRLAATEVKTNDLALQAQALARDLMCHVSGDGAQNDSRSPVETQTGGFVLRGYYDRSLFSDPSVLVTAERAAPLPPIAGVVQATSLTSRQAEVALLIAEGRSDQEIADRLFISVHTARRHSAAVLKGLDVPSRAGVALALLTRRS